MFTEDILQYHSLGEKKFPGIYYSLLAELYNFVPEVEHTALVKVRATKQQNETTPGN